MSEFCDPWQISGLYLMLHRNIRYKPQDRIRILNHKAPYFHYACNVSFENNRVMKAELIQED